MSSLNKDSLIPLTSLLAGVLATCLFVAWRQQPQPELVAAEDRFGSLSAVEQEDVRNKAASYVRNSNEQDRLRIEAIHEAVQHDPSLLKKLEELNGLLKTLDEESRAKLEPNGEFAEDWVRLVQEFHHQYATAVPTIEIRLPGPPSPERKRNAIRFTERQFEEFLDAAISGEMPAALRSKLERFSSPEQQCEHTLTKIVWLSQQLLSEENTSVDSGQLMNVAMEHLMQSEWRQRFQEFTGRKPQVDHIKDPRERSEALKQIQMRTARMKSSFVLMFLKHALWHFEEAFHETHLPANSDPAEIFETEMKRDRQLALMRMDPTDAGKVLESEIIERNSFTNQAVADLNKDIKDLKHRFREKDAKMQSRHRGFGRWPDGRFGPREREDGRPRGEGFSRGGGQQGGNGFRGDRPPERRDGENPDRRPPPDQKKPRPHEPRPPSD